MEFYTLAVAPEIWVSIIGFLQVLIVTFGLYFLKTNKTRREEREAIAKEYREAAMTDRKVIMEQLKPSNGKTIAQVVELVNDKIDMMDKNVGLVNQKVDEHHKLVTDRLDRHEEDDAARFESLENIIQKESGDIQRHVL